MWTLQDAKNRFSTVVEAALAGSPQEITRRGKTAVMVVSTSDYRRLVGAARLQRGSFADQLLAFPAGPDPEPIGRADAAPRDVDL